MRFGLLPPILFFIQTVLGSTPEIPIYDPVFKFYEPHEGEVVNVAFSPNRKDMFMSNGTDGEIRVYMIGQVKIKREYDAPYC